MQEIEGQIIEIIFQNETNGYTVCEFHTENLGEVTVVGYLPFISKGDSLKLTGTMVVHKEYGEQFKVECFEKIINILNKDKDYTKEQKHLLEIMLNLIFRNKINNDNITDNLIRKINKEEEKEMLAILDTIAEENERILQKEI